MAESGKAREITRSFFSEGPDGTTEQLFCFFSERFNIKDPETIIRLWTSMLFAYRSEILMGGVQPVR